MTLKIKNMLRLIFVLLIIGSFSVLLHEFIHVLQFHYLYGIPLNELELHFMWEFDGSNISMPEKITSHPVAWISFESFRPITANERLLIEIPAYIIQYGFLFAFYFKYIHRKEKFVWR